MRRQSRRTNFGRGEGRNKAGRGDPVRAAPGYKAARICKRGAPRAKGAWFVGRRGEWKCGSNLYSKLLEVVVTLGYQR